VVGIDLGPETAVVFGNPRAGTPLTQDDPRIWMELPLPIVLWNSDDVTKRA
jgi:uncharacterized protein (DUF302 family)